MNISAPIMGTSDLFPAPPAATSSWNSLSRPLSIITYARDLSDELLTESPAAISKYMTSSSHSHSHSGSSSKLFNISSSYPKSSPISLSSSTPPKIEITIDNSLFDDFYTTATASLSEAADEHSIIRFTSDCAEEGSLPASPTDTFQSSGYSIYDDGCTQYSTPTSTLTDSSCSSESCPKSAANALAASFSAASRVHGASCTGSISQNHTTSITMEAAPASFTGTLWVGGDNEDCLTQTFINEPVFLAEYDDDDDDLDHLVCYTKLRPRMASFVR
ncbi:hypothetical protein D0Z00_002802 [Geotrichum galactomycetum]|uniref:Uncharacterized protein n=1 Tax=Geotrichum galactomycetum TaxID=27317 RepID=A0ACB6V336_9ASCO|nr:hypothetical protein D0Z00_002802 [Geotrichum candidum]